MKAKQKAEELIRKFIEPTIKFNTINGVGYYNDLIAATQCALILVEEILTENEKDECDLSYVRANYWEEVKQEINFMYDSRLSNK